VENLEASIGFYNRLFGQNPAKQQADYAKWMLEDPRVNFAISARGHSSGVNHFGFQVDTPEELATIKQLAESAAPGSVLEQSSATCCYASSEKHWTIDPQGLAWEHFVTMSDAPVFGNETANQAGACCVPIRNPQPETSSAKAACCITDSAPAAGSACCG
jgi:hypothetical protein